MAKMDFSILNFSSGLLNVLPMLAKPAPKRGRAIALTLFSFASLKKNSNKKGSYLIRDHNISYLYSATWWQVLTDASKNKEYKLNLLAVAPSNFFQDGDSTLNDLSELSYTQSTVD